MHKWFWLSILCLLFSTASFAVEKAIILKINNAITPATQDYIKRGISIAKEQQAAFIILELNTPGGLETAMREINAAIIASPIPIITYVAPSGARAASAGTFIMYASHLSAMAPGTNIGAATPVNLTGSETESKPLTAEKQKATNDAAAYMRSLAQLRNRNADWGEQAVKHAASLSAIEAKKLNVINEVANNYPDLLQKINNKTVQLQDKTIQLHTKDVELKTIEPDWRYQFLSFITNPNIAYILMLIALYGLFFEFSNPGLVLPGVAGIIALLLALYAFQLMPVNYVGLSLIILGVGFMIFEVYVSSFGVIGVGGIIAFIIGSIMLFDTPNQDYHVTWGVIGLMSIVTAIFFLMLITLAIRSHKKLIATGREGLIGSSGVVLSMMNEQIVVRVLGEIWNAKSTSPLKIGQKIKVIAIHGLTLDVKPTDKN